MTCGPNTKDTSLGKLRYIKPLYSSFLSKITKYNRSHRELNSKKPEDYHYVILPTRPYLSFETKFPNGIKLADFVQ